MRYSILLICLIYYSGCSQSQSIDVLDKEIISEMIDRNSYPIPPPPPIGSNDTIIPQKLLDSLDKIRLKVAIYPLMIDEISESSNDELKTSVYYNIISSEKLETKKIGSLRGIVSKVGHSLILADTINIRNPTAFEELDLLLNFSRIKYNKDATKAVFELSVSRGRLNGSSAIYCLKKENGKWFIDLVVPTWIS